MFILHFSPTGSLGIWLEIHYRQGGKFFCFAGFFEVVGLKMSGQGDSWGPKGFLGGHEGKRNFKG